MPRIHPHTLVAVGCIGAQLAVWLTLAFFWMIFIHNHWAVLAIACSVFLVATVFYMVSTFVLSLVFRLCGWVSPEQKNGLIVYSNIILMIPKRDINDVVDVMTVLFTVSGTFFIGVVLTSYVAADYFVRNKNRLERTDIEN